MVIGPGDSFSSHPRPSRNSVESRARLLHGSTGSLASQMFLADAEQGGNVMSRRRNRTSMQGTGPPGMERSETRLSRMGSADKTVGRGLTQVPSMHPIYGSNERKKRHCIHAIDPEDRRYMAWWYFVMGVALWSAVLEPFEVGFGSHTGFYPAHSFWTINIAVTTIIFFTDIGLKFFLAYENEQEVLITHLGKIFGNYTKKLFWFDLLFAFPLDGVIVAALGGHENVSEQTLMLISLLRYLKLGRLYRIFDFFGILDRSMVISQMSLILIRNQTFIFFTAHWFSCLIYFIGRMEDLLGKDSWTGRAVERLEGQPTIIQYVYALYYAVNMLTGVGDGDFYSASPLESLAMIIYLIFNIVLNAYILGTITMLVVKGDERSKKFRDRVTYLREYSKINNVPEELVRAMKEHLELYFQSENTTDSNVLDIYPLAIKRKVLRHLYAQPVKMCYLFQGAKSKFVDDLLAVSRVELFMPNVQIMVEGDAMQDLCIVIDGEVELMVMGDGVLRTSHKGAKSGEVERAAPSVQKGKSFIASRRMSMCALAGGSVLGNNIVWNKRTTSDPFGEVAFFTETPSLESGWTNTVVRVLQIDKDSFEKVAAKSPQPARLLLTNLENKVSEGMLEVLWESVTSSLTASEGLRNFVGDIMMEQSSAKSLQRLSMKEIEEIRNLLPASQVQKFGQFLAISEAVSRFTGKHLMSRSQEMFTAASDGDIKTVKKLMEMEIPVNIADLHKRTPLMIAAEAGHAELCDYLLHKDADPLMIDAFGYTAMYYAISKKHVTVMETLLQFEGTLGISSQLESYHLMSCVRNGDKERVKMFLEAQADANVTDVDGRSPLHTACSSSGTDEEMVRLLLQHGGNPSLVDLAGRSPLFEAVDVGHSKVVDVLKKHGASLVLDPSMEAYYVLNCITVRNLSRLKLLLRAGASPDAKDMDGRSAVQLASRAGDLHMVKVLVSYGADYSVKDAYGISPIEAAEKAGADDVVAYLKSSPEKDSDLIRQTLAHSITSCNSGFLTTLGRRRASLCVDPLEIMGEKSGRVSRSNSRNARSSSRRASLLQLPSHKDLDQLERPTGGASLFSDEVVKETQDRTSVFKSAIKQGDRETGKHKGRRVSIGPMPTESPTVVHNLGEPTVVQSLGEPTVMHNLGELTVVHTLEDSASSQLPTSPPQGGPAVLNCSSASQAEIDMNSILQDAGESEPAAAVAGASDLGVEHLAGDALTDRAAALPSMSPHPEAGLQGPPDLMQEKSLTVMLSDALRVASMDIAPGDHAQDSPLCVEKSLGSLMAEVDNMSMAPDMGSRGDGSGKRRMLGSSGAARRRSNLAPIEAASSSGTGEGAGAQRGPSPLSAMLDAAIDSFRPSSTTEAAAENARQSSDRAFNMHGSRSASHRSPHGSNFRDPRAHITLHQPHPNRAIHFECLVGDT